MNASVNSTIDVESGSVLAKWYKKQLVFFDKNFFGMMMMYMIIQSCVGAIATMFVYITGGSSIYMMISITLAMWVNAMLISQASKQVIIVSFYASVLINAVILLAHVI